VTLSGEQENGKLNIAAGSIVMLLPRRVWGFVCPHLIPDLVPDFQVGDILTTPSSIVSRPRYIDTSTRKTLLFISTRINSMPLSKLS